MALRECGVRRGVQATENLTTGYRKTKIKSMLAMPPTCGRGDRNAPAATGPEHADRTGRPSTERLNEVGLEAASRAATGEQDLGPIMKPAERHRGVIKSRHQIRPKAGTKSPVNLGRHLQN